ncbi:hypothetical protein [Halorubrum sp. AS12]|uniref:hypothetical protein n=1 Tax=Halorubrum sp. AS12 TaxID=3409687 RepID=UPI003DA73572
MHGDHGEAFGEHGVYSHEPYFYEENIHVPLLAYGDGSDRIKEPISVRRIPDLVIDAANGKLAENVRQQTGTFSVSRTAADHKISLRGSNWKYVHGDDNDVTRLVDLDDKELPTNGHSELLERLAQNSEESIRERQRINEAVADAFVESQL